MKTKRILSLILALCLFCGIAPAIAAGPAGSSSDPLVSKSFIDGAFRDAVLKNPLELLKNSMQVLEYKLMQKTTGVNILTLTPATSLFLESGASFTLLSGGANMGTLTGTLIDVTAGVIVEPKGQPLTVGHRYVAGANTHANFGITATSKISAMGSVRTEKPAMPFTDVISGAWFYNDVFYAYTHGLINGKSEISFAPDDNLKINEAIKLAACMHQLYNTGAVTLVNGTTTWYSTYLDYATTNGIVTKTYTDYDAYIKRDEFVNIFYSALPASQYTAINTVTDNAIPDVKTTDANASRIYAFYRAGILNGKDGKGSFLPAENILRSEVAAIMTRMFEKDHRVAITLQ